MRTGQQAPRIHSETPNNLSQQEAEKPKIVAKFTICYFEKSGLKKGKPLNKRGKNLIIFPKQLHENHTDP